MKKRRRNLICERAWGGGGCILMHPFDLHVVTGVFWIMFSAAVRSTQQTVLR